MPSSGRFLTMDDYDLSNKSVYLRVDVNSPINPMTGEIMDVSRFVSHLDTLHELVDSKVVIVGHQSRPGNEDFTSFRLHAGQLERLLNRPVKYVDSLFNSEVRRSIRNMENGEIIMLENSRFFSEEIVIDPSDIQAMESTHIVRELGPLFDYFVIDAFPAIHRAQTTLVGFRRIKPNLAGRLVEREVTMLDRLREGNEHPKVAILAGSKISDSISVSEHFLGKSIVDSILVGGVVANAFLWASGKNIGKRNEELIIKNNKNYKELLEKCKKLLAGFKNKIIMPVDFVLNPSNNLIEADAKIPDTDLLADIGLETASLFKEIISKSKAVFVNGPMGMYEIENYSFGTREILETVASSNALTIAGGGHTISALEKLGLKRKFSHVSTGGGALISYLSGEPMPVLESLAESKKLFGGKSHGK